MRRRLWVLEIVAVALLVGACATGVDVPDVGAEGLAGLRQRARDELARYDRAVTAAGGPQRFIPVGELTGQVGDWEPANGENNKAAVMAGLVHASDALPPAPTLTGEVIWEDGTRLALPLGSADETLNRLRVTAAGTCTQCTPLQVVGARLTTVRIQTTRGPATVPAWEFTLTGTTVKLTRVAISASSTVSVTPLPWDPDHARGGPTVESATTTLGSNRLTVTFAGAPGPRSEPCGADYTGEAVESANAVIVIVLAIPAVNKGPCSGIGAYRTATVDLAEPLGERAVLEIQRGLPVALTITR